MSPVTSVISGVMIFKEVLGDKVIAIVKFFLMYYFVNINDAIANSLSDIGFELIMQLLFKVAFILIGLLYERKAQRA